MMCLRDQEYYCGGRPAARIQHSLALGSGFSEQTEERRGVALIANSDVISCSDFSLLLPKSLHCRDTLRLFLYFCFCH